MNNHLIVLGIAVLLICVGLSGCTDVEIPDDSIQLSIMSFEVEPSIINQGDTANLSWVVVGATSVSIDNGIGNISLTGNRIVAPSETTNYTLTASNSTATITATTQVIVTMSTNGEENNPPTALASASPTNGFAPLEVNFYGNGIDTDGQVISYHWNFGDGNTSNLRNTTHVYYNEGSYAVALVVTDDDGATGIDTVSIIIEEKEVGLSVTGVTGYASNETTERITIFIRPIEGTDDIDMTSVMVELDNETNTVQLSYDSNNYNESPSNIFDCRYFSLTNQQFGIIVLNDADNSCTRYNPIMNTGDNLILTVNITSCFNGFPTRTNVSGTVTPEDGTPGIISFVTPSEYIDTIYDLQ